MPKKNLIPVMMLKKFRGRNAGEVFGFSPKLCMQLVNAGVARWYDEDAASRAEKLGFVAKNERSSELDMEIAARAEEKAQAKMAQLNSEMSAKDAEIAKLKSMLESKQSEAKLSEGGEGKSGRRGK